MRLQDINTETLEGKLLMSALGILTSQSYLKIENRSVIGTRTTPEEMLKYVENLKTYIYNAN